MIICRTVPTRVKLHKILTFAYTRTPWISLVASLSCVHHNLLIKYIGYGVLEYIGYGVLEYIGYGVLEYIGYGVLEYIG